MKHFKIGLCPEEDKDKENPYLYDAWLFTDIKTHRGAVNRALRYKKHTGSARGDRFVTALLTYKCSTVDGITPPIRKTFV